MIADTGVNALLNTYIIILLISIFISSDTHLLNVTKSWKINFWNMLNLTATARTQLLE